MFFFLLLGIAEVLCVCVCVTRSESSVSTILFETNTVPTRCIFFVYFFPGSDKEIVQNIAFKKIVSENPEEKKQKRRRYWWIGRE